MSTYLMQARSTSTGDLVTWVFDGASPDDTGTQFPGPGSPEYIASTKYVGASTPGIVEEAPEITSLDQITGSGAGGTTVVITGLHLFTVDRIEGDSGDFEIAFVVDSDTQITIPAMPAHVAGTVSLHAHKMTLGLVSNGANFIYTEPVAWAPPDAALPILVWYRPDLGAVLTGALVDSLADQSGNGDANRNLTGTGGTRPTISVDTGVYGDFDTIHYAGTPLYALGAWSVPPAPPISIIIVGDTVSAVGMLCDSSPRVNGTTPYNMLYSPSPNRVDWFNGNRVDALFAPNVALPSVIMITDNGSTNLDAAKVFVNSLAIAVASDIAVMTAGRSFDLGAGNAGVDNASGIRHAEVLIYGGDLSDPANATDLANLVEYLTVTRPYGIEVSNVIDPATLSGKQLLFDPAIGITMSGSDRVGLWADQSGSGDANRNLTQTLYAKCPAFNASDADYNGHPTIEGVASRSTVLRSGTFATPITQPYTLYFVGECSASGNLLDTLLVHFTSGERVLLFDEGLGSLSFNAGSGSGYLIPTGGDAGVFAYVVQGATSGAYGNSLSAAGTPGTFTATEAMKSIQLFDSYNFANPASAKVAFFAVFAGAHDDVTRKGVMAFLSKKYAQPITV